LQIIGVIDLLGGRAVHAKGGRRHPYRPLETAGGVAVDGDPVALARFYVERLGLDQLYIADLDAIAGGNEQDEVVRMIAAQTSTIWLDAGVANPVQARRALARGVSRVVVGLETLPSFDALRAIVDANGRDAVAFSLDLRDGRPIASSSSIADMSPDAIARHAVAAGVGAVIVLDLARVGSGRGLDGSVVERARRAVPDVQLLAGGGVRDAEDLRRLAAMGCDGALVATALHGADAAGLLGAARGAGVHG